MSDEKYQTGRFGRHHFEPGPPPWTEAGRAYVKKWDATNYQISAAARRCLYEGSWPYATRWERFKAWLRSLRMKP